MLSSYDAWKLSNGRDERRSYRDLLDDGDESFERKRERRWDEDEELDDVQF